MRRLGILLLFAAAPVLATTIVYKSEGADGVTILSDRPIKNVDHQEIIHLDTPEFAQQKAPVGITKSTPVVTQAPSNPIDHRAIQTKIALAKLNIEKAENQLTRARIAQLKAKRECEVTHYRSNTQNEDCKAISSTTEEVQLAHARSVLSQLENLDSAG